MLFIFYLISINTLLFCLMCIEKKRAIKNQFIISEKKILTLAFMGGSFSILLSMRLIHHKGKKFKNLIPILTIESFFLLFLTYKILFS